MLTEEERSLLLTQLTTSRDIATATDDDSSSNNNNNFDATRVHALSRVLGGVTVFRKGASDLISSGNDVFAISEQGSNRRCGGQGDILSGCLGVSLNWALQVKVCNVDC